jgi:hypothetical protein
VVKAGQRVDAVASVLVKFAMDHPNGGLLDPTVRLLDSALRLLERA